MAEGKTKALRKSFAKHSIVNALIVDGSAVDAKFAAAARNLPNIDVLPARARTFTTSCAVRHWF